MFAKNKKFAEAYNDLYPVVFSAVYSKVGTIDDAEDLCQELFIKFFNKLDEIENHRKWLYGALKLEVMAYYRKKKPGAVDIDEVFNDVGLTFVNGFRDSRIMIQDTLEEMNNYRDETDRALFDLVAVRNFSCCLIFAMPIGYLKGIAERGYGATLSARVENLLVTGLFCGIDARFLYLEGKGSMQKAMMVPLLARFGYAYAVWRVSIVPFVSAGGCYSMNYYYTDRFRYWKVRRNGFQPMLNAGLSFDFLAGKNVYIRIGADYNIIFEKAGDISFFTCLAGMGLKF